MEPSNNTFLKVKDKSSLLIKEFDSEMTLFLSNLKGVSGQNE